MRWPTRPASFAACAVAAALSGCTLVSPGCRNRDVKAALESEARASAQGWLSTYAGGANGLASQATFQLKDVHETAVDGGTHACAATMMVGDDKAQIPVPIDYQVSKGDGGQPLYGWDATAFGKTFIQQAIIAAVSAPRRVTPQQTEAAPTPPPSPPPLLRSPSPPVVSAPQAVLPPADATASLSPAPSPQPPSPDPPLTTMSTPLVASPSTTASMQPPPAPYASDTAPRRQASATRPEDSGWGDVVKRLILAQASSVPVESSGTVVVSFDVSATGDIGNVRVARSSGDAGLDAAAVRIVKQTAHIDARYGEAVTGFTMKLSFL